MTPPLLLSYNKHKDGAEEIGLRCIRRSAAAAVHTSEIERMRR